MQDTVRNPKEESLAWAASALVVAAGVAAAAARPALPDTAWPLYIARQLLRGASLTGDFQEMNPPLYVWELLPAAALARLTGVSLWLTAVVILGGVILVSLLLADRALAAGSLARQRAVLLPLLAFAFSLFPLGEFTNREHLALVMVVPYLLLGGVRAEGGAISPGLAAACGLLGGLGFAHKPYFLPAWVLVEAFLLGRVGARALRRPELFALVALGAAYAAAILLIEPGYLLLVRTWVGLYGQYLRNILWYAMFPDGWALLPILAVGGAVALSARGEARPVHQVLVVAGLGFWIGAVLQRKGFSYHHLTGGGLGFLALALAGATSSVRRPRRPSDLVIWIARGAAAWVVVWSTWVVAGEAAGRRLPSHLDPAYPQLRATVHTLARGKPILVLSSNPAAGWPLTLEADAIWAMPFMSQWQFPALYGEQLWRKGGVVQPTPFPLRTGIERTFHEVMIESIERSRPALIVVLAVDSTVWGFGGATRIDYLGYFGSDPRFRQIMEGYRELPAHGRYRLFQRRGDVDRRR